MKLKFTTLYFLITFSTVFGQNLTVDFDTTIKTGINKGVASANLCWLLDSDLPTPNPTQSMRTALSELGVKSLRFPYGALAENYLWDTAPFNSTKSIGNLTPKVASTSKNPGNWTWSTNPDGTFIKAMDFDEYMSICQELNIQPLVVVNIQSSEYAGGPTAQELIDSAVEWIKYANDKNYNVAYWQIGNEVEHANSTVFTKAEYVSHYVAMATAMKTEDSTIKVGPGILSSIGYFNTIIDTYPNLIDFISAHQYMYSFTETCATYDLWKENTESYIPNVTGVQNAVLNSSKPTMEILVTETGVTPAKDGFGSINNTYKALWWFEVLMNQIQLSNVSYSYFWGTHSPWNSGETPIDDAAKDVGLLLRVDDNSRKPTAEIVKLVNENMLENLVQTTQSVNYIRTFASISNDDTKYCVFLMNKSNVTQNVVVQLNQLPANTTTLSRKEFKGATYDDISPTVENVADVNVSLDDTITITLEPLSVTILNNKIGGCECN